MRSLPPGFSDRDEMTTVVVRTDRTDDAAWHDTLRRLGEAPDGWDDDGDGDATDMAAYVVDDPAWDGASVDEVLAVFGADEFLAVLFLADTVTMTHPERPLLAVTTDDPDDEYYAETTAHGREFRILPPESHALNVNLELANMDFQDWSEVAADAPGRIFRAFPA